MATFPGMVSLDDLRHVEGLLASCIRRPRLENSQPLVDLCEVAPPAIVRLVGRLFDVPVELLPRLRRPALVLCQSAAELLGTEATWVGLIDRVFELLEHRVQPRSGLHLKEHPFLFHYAACHEAEETGRARVYEALALPTHLGLRSVEAELHRSPFGAARRLENLYRYALAARIFLRYVPVELVATPQGSAIHPLPEPVVDAAFLLAGRALGAPTREAWTPTLRDHHGRVLAMFCVSRPIRPRYPPGPPGTRLCRILTGPRISTYLEVADGQETVITTDAPAEALAEGESPWDYARAIEVPEGGRPPWAVPRRGAQSTTPWDAGVLQPAELAAVYKSFCASPLEGQSSDELALALGTLQILHTGLDPISILGMAGDTAPNGERPPVWLSPGLKTIAHELPEGLPSSPDPLPPDQYLPGGRLVELPLPGVLAQLVTAYEAQRAGQDGRSPGGPYLQLRGPHGPRPLGLLDLERRLRTISARVTSVRLRRTFDALYGWAGLEPILGAFISNRFPFRLLSTAFYTNIATEELAARYVDAHRRVHELILAHWQGVPPAWLSSDEPSRREMAGRVGSWLVPRLDRVRLFFDAIAARLATWARAPEEVGVERCHNLYTVYVYLSLLWATAMRPRRDPLVDRAALRGQGWLIVADKHNRTYRESRPGPVADAVWPMLGSLDRGGQVLRRHLGTEGRLVDLNEDVLFFVIRGGALRELTSTLVREVLREEGLPYEWKLNGQRHLWISRRIQRRQPLARIEPFLGHVHEDLEPWGRYSFADLGRRAEEFRGMAAEILEAIGIRMLPHPLEGLRW